MIFPVKGIRDKDWRISNFFSASHPGIDIAPLPAGTRGIRCYAPERAVVLSSAYIASLEGNYIILQGSSGMYYYFGHFEKRLVGKGASVGEGQVIGVLGNTGYVKPAPTPDNPNASIHTHHEVRRTRSGSQVDPLVYYKNNVGGGSTVDWEAKAKEYLAAAAEWEQKARDRLAVIVAQQKEIDALKATNPEPKLVALGKALKDYLA